MRGFAIAIAAAYIVVTALAVALAWQLDARVDRWLLWAEVRRILRRGESGDAR